MTKHQSPMDTVRALALAGAVVIASGAFSPASADNICLTNQAGGCGGGKGGVTNPCWIAGVPPSETVMFSKSGKTLNCWPCNPAIGCPDVGTYTECITFVTDACPSVLDETGD